MEAKLIGYSWETTFNPNPPCRPQACYYQCDGDICPEFLSLLRFRSDCGKPDLGIDQAVSFLLLAVLQDDSDTEKEDHIDCYEL